MISIGPTNANEARRSLRAALLARGASDVPHSHDSAALVARARTELRKRGPADSQRALSIDLALVLGWGGEVDEARDILDAALSAERGVAASSRIRVLIATQLDLRQGRPGHARELFIEAINAGGLGRRLRAWTQFELARAYRSLGELGRARTAIHEGLAMRVNDAMPALNLGLAAIARTEGRHTESERRLRKARSLYHRRADASGSTRCVALRAAWHLDDDEVEAAIPLLHEAGRAFLDALDLTQLARVTHNLGVAHARSGRYDDALACYAHAMHHHVEAGRFDQAMQSLRAAGACKERAGDTALSLALHHRGAEVALAAETPIEAFRAILECLVVIARHRDPLRAVPFLVARAHTLLPGVEHDLSRDELLRLAAVSGQLGRLGAPIARRLDEPRPRSFPERKAEARARAYVDDHIQTQLRPTLVERIHEGLPVRWTGRETTLAEFLLSWAGTSFRNRDYQVEFGVPQGHAKHHLREFREAGLIRQRGIKKGARYLLSFQDGMTLVPDELRRPGAEELAR